MATTRKDKARALLEFFFFFFVTADLRDIHPDTAYFESIPLPEITEQEIEQTVKNTTPNKAPKEDGIPNRILKLALPIIMPVLKWIYNNSIRLSYCPKHFRESIIVILRKSNKDDYFLPKSYRPIALLNTIEKVLESIIATRLSYIAEEYKLLPRGHFGGRRGTSPEHALHYIMETIHSVWAKKKVVSMLLLDVIEAFDNVSHPRLIHNLKRKGIGGNHLAWLESFLSDRHTVLKLVDHTSQRVRTSVRVPQGSPLSPILYIFYNAAAIEWCTNPARGMSACGFIDDIGIIVVENTAEDNLINLKIAHDWCEIWASTHGFIFNKSKYELIHFRKFPAIGPEMVLRLSGIDLVPSPTCKYLGVVMDSQLIWRPHLAYLKKKSTAKLSVLAALAGFTWGIGIGDLRRTYIVTVLPQFTYCASV